MWEFPSKIQSVVGLPNEILVCTLESPAILSLSYDGEVNVAGTSSFTEMKFVKDPADGNNNMKRENGNQKNLITTPFHLSFYSSRCQPEF